MLAANYRSGDDFVVEFLGHRFEFSVEDFEERVTAAAVRLGLVGSNDLDEDEAADLVELVADGRIEDPRSGLGLYIVRHWEHVSLARGESLVYWLRKLVFRGAWLDQRVLEGELEILRASLRDGGAAILADGELADLAEQARLATFIGEVVA